MCYLLYVCYVKVCYIYLHIMAINIMAIVYKIGIKKWPKTQKFKTNISACTCSRKCSLQLLNYVERTFVLMFQFQSFFNLVR